MKANTFNRLLQNIHKDSRAIEKIYLFYNSKIILHLSYKYGRETAEECAQEFFIKLIEIADKQDYIYYPTTWVYKCCENIAKSKIQKAIVPVEINQEIENRLLFIDREYFGDLYQELEKLDNQSRNILIMIYWEGYNQKEIAEILKLNSATVRKKHSRALKQLKKYL
ncbi:MAG TPA: sigma-70 family RNA polymerase sigma factor [Candidatus Ornithoclostridium faecavium]|nr:sigma-70 family RNA polymerase sigma factor [Candidatus Ornithoclostridium faecavium]